MQIPALKLLQPPGLFMEVSSYVNATCNQFIFLICSVLFLQTYKMNTLVENSKCLLFLLLLLLFFFGGGGGVLHIKYCIL
jgi:hypothetical protein